MNREVKEDESQSEITRQHGKAKGEAKRIQANSLAECLIEMMMSQLVTSREEAIKWLNQGSGVLDIAGGIGHVSMALSLRGIQSTVIDPRPSVGKLPSRDRKVYRRALSKKQTIAAVEFGTCRAWFGVRPNEADHDLREGGGPDTIEVCSPCTNAELLGNCSAVVALHPDEATDYVIDFAIEHQKPFVVVPCCVFSRLFPWRRVSGKRVSTYQDLVTYLKCMHPNIQATVLDFDGANQALWCASYNNTPALA